MTSCAVISDVRVHGHSHTLMLGWLGSCSRSAMRFYLPPSWPMAAGSRQTGPGIARRRSAGQPRREVVQLNGQLLIGLERLARADRGSRRRAAPAGAAGHAARRRPRATLEVERSPRGPPARRAGPAARARRCAAPLRGSGCGRHRRDRWSSPAPADAGAIRLGVHPAADVTLERRRRARRAR